ncbi:MAG: REP-associated tyrosine transposase [Bacteroidota bacterium]
MSRNYKFWNQEYPFFISFSVINWIDLFTRRSYCEILLDSWKYCKRNKGLIIHAWCIMPSHVYMIISTNGPNLSGIVRDFKSITSKQLREEIAQNHSASRRRWMLWMMKQKGVTNGRNHDFQLWQHHNHPIQLDTGEKLEQRLWYLHLNPVKAGFVDEAEDWVMSSARDYAGSKGLLEISLLD